MTMCTFSRRATANEWSPLQVKTFRAASPDYLEVQFFLLEKEILNWWQTEGLLSESLLPCRPARVLSKSLMCSRPGSY